MLFFLRGEEFEEKDQESRSSEEFAFYAWIIRLSVTLFIGCGSMWPPDIAWGQAGLYAKPWFTYGEEFDDNVFNNTDGRQSDVVTRFTPGLEFGYRSEPFTLLGSYDFDAEIFAKKTKLTQAQARQHGSLRFEYKPSRLWTLGLVGEYVETERPEDLNATTGIVGERGRSRGYQLNPSIIYHFDAVTAGTSRYSLVRNERPSGGAIEDVGASSNTHNDEHSAEFAIARTLTSRDKGALTYNFRHFVATGIASSELKNGASVSSSSHVFTLGWIRQISSLITLSLRGGPRISRDDVAPEVEGSLARRFQHGEIMFTYARTQNIAVGKSGPVETESYLGAVSYQPLSRLTIRANPAYYINDGEGSRTKVYRLDLNATYVINLWLSVQASYRFSYEQESGRLRSSSSSGDRYRNVIFLELTIAPQYRLW